MYHFHVLWGFLRLFWTVFWVWRTLVRHWLIKATPVNFPNSEAKGHRFDSCRAHHNLERAYFVKGSEPFLFQAENINLGTSKRKLVNRWNLEIPDSQSWASKRSAKYNELPEFRSRKFNWAFRATATGHVAFRVAPWIAVHPDGQPTLSRSRSRTCVSAQSAPNPCQSNALPALSHLPRLDAGCSHNNILYSTLVEWNY